MVASVRPSDGMHLRPVDRLRGWARGRFPGVERYLDVILFVLSDSVGRYRRPVFKIVGLSSLGAALELAAMFGVIFYASSIAQSPSLNILGLLDVPRSSTAALVTVLSLTWLCLVFSSRLTYYARVAIIRLGRRYERFCATRVFESISKAADAAPASDSRESFGQKDLFDLARKHSQGLGRVLRILMRQTSAIVTLALAAGVMLYIATTLTCIVFGLACISLYFQANISRLASQASVQMQTFSQRAAKVFKTEIGARLDGTHADNARTVDHPDVERYVGAFDRRLTALEQSRWVSGVMIATMLAIVILILGVDIFERESGWGSLLIYLVAAKFALTSIQSLLLGLTSINRFYPKLRKYREFQQNMVGE